MAQNNFKTFLSDKATSTDLIVFFVALLAAAWWFRRRHHNLPPGPISLPLVGYLPFLTSKPYVKLWELSKKYGPVFSIKLGNQYTVVLSDYQSIKEAFVQDAFMGRPPESPFEISEENKRTGAMNGLKFKDQRRFSMHVLRDLGFGKSVMEQHIREEITELLERMNKEAGKPVSVSNMLAPSMSNNIASLMFGKRRRFDDPKRIALDKSFRDIGVLIGQTAWMLFFPWIKPIVNILGLSKQKELSIANQINREYIEEEVEEHQKNFDPNNLKDYIDNYLLEIEKNKSDPDTTFNVPVMKDMVGAFFGGGSETVRISMDWLLLICATKPHVQKRVQDEIDDVIGPERFPSKEDQKRMPYTTAVINEMLRWITILPLNLFRYTLQDVELMSYFIPKDTNIWANLWAVHHDPQIWGEDHDVFKPERFLSSDGKEVKKSECLIPFSVGKRSCPGEALAQMEIFLYFTSLLQKFNFKLPEGATHNFEGIFGIGLTPKPYDLVYKPR